MNKSALLSSEVLEGCDLVIFGSSRADFSEDEFSALRSFVDQGGSLAFLVPALNREQATNVHYFLEEYGFIFDSCKSPTVIRSSFYKYFHPKHVHIANGILHPDIQKAFNERARDAQEIPIKKFSSNSSEVSNERNEIALSFVYTNGIILNCRNKAVPILSSGPVSFPTNQAIAGTWKCDDNDKFGKILVIGSAEMFADEWIDEENNKLLSNILVEYLLPKADDESPIQLDIFRGVEASSIHEYTDAPDIQTLANNLKICLERPSQLPQDFMSLYDGKQFGFDFSTVPEVIGLYTRLKVDHKPLTLIAPEFERPVPPLQLATFPPKLRDIKPPALDLFDLEEHFASKTERLEQLANKCSSGDEDLIYFMKESINILGMQLDIKSEAHEDSARSALNYVFEKVS